MAALLAQNRGNHESAVDAWIQLVDGESQDESFPGQLLLLSRNVNEVVDNE